MAPDGRRGPLIARPRLQVSGCIPVLINNSVWAPFEPWRPLVREFAHVFTLEEAPSVVKVLRAEGDAERSVRRAAMRQHYPKFLWDETHGEAYNMTMGMLAEAVGAR